LLKDVRLAKKITIPEKTVIKQQADTVVLNVQKSRGIAEALINTISSVQSDNYGSW
jgi:hypothetical protein